MKGLISISIGICCLAFVGCKTTANTGSSNESGDAGSTTTSTTTATTSNNTDSNSATNSTTGVDFPFDNTLSNVEASTTDGSKVTISVSYKGKVKPSVVNQRIYIPETIEPLVGRACIKVVMSRNKEQLGEAYLPSIRSDIFREVSSSIDPTEVSVTEVKIVDLTIVR